MKKITIYIDGSCKGNPGPGKSLALFINPEGDEWTREKTFEHTTSNRAEYEALKIALMNCYLTENPNKEIFDITIYTDSKLIEGHINKKWKVNKNIELVNECKKLIEGIKIIDEHLIKIEWVSRDQNKAGLILEVED